MEDRSVFDLPSPEGLSQLAYGQDVDQVMDVVGDARPGVGPIALLHGGFWRPAFDRQHLRPLAVALSERAPTFNIEYRRIPGEPALQFDDICLALELIHERQGAAPVVIGHSAGGHLALLAAIHRPDLVRGCVAIAPISDLRAAEANDDGKGAVSEFLGASAEDHPNLDPASLGHPTVPWVILHGVTDIQVPIDMSHGYGGEVIAHDVGHFEWIDPRHPSSQLMMQRVWDWAADSSTC